MFAIFTRTERTRIANRNRSEFSFAGDKSQGILAERARFELGIRRMKSQFAALNRNVSL